MHRDTVIGIVGVVILVAAMVGVFTYERGQATTAGGATGGTLANATLAAIDGSVAIGATAENPIVINQTGLTNVTFTLTWTAGQNSVDTLRLIAAPGADTGLTTGFESDPESDGEIVLQIPLNNTGAAGTLGTGNWSISVEFVNSQVAGPAGPPLDPGAIPAGDQNVDFSVATAVQRYA